MSIDVVAVVFFFFNDTATTEIYTLSLHDALPISLGSNPGVGGSGARRGVRDRAGHHPFPPARRYRRPRQDRKSTRLNSSHQIISYAVFCLKKKKTQPARRTPPTLSGS